MTTRSNVRRLAATLGLALLIGALGLLIPALVSLFSIDAGWTASPWISYGAMAIACFIGGWKFELSPFLGLLVGYLFGWFNLVVANGQIVLGTFGRSPGAMLMLFLIAPLSYAIIGLSAALFGWLVRKLDSRRQ